MVCRVVMVTASEWWYGRIPIDEPAYATHHIMQSKQSSRSSGGLFEWSIILLEFQSNSTRCGRETRSKQGT